VRSSQSREPPSPSLVEYLVELGIDSISVTPDTLLQVTRNVLALEQRPGHAPRVELSTATATP
jgi:hypothetical protein